MSETIGISPGVGILSVFRYIKYKAWYALAEYVDNAIDSYQKNSAALKATYPGYRLLIDIELNHEDNYIKVRDNAAGINGVDLERALRMAMRPPDRSGLSEFGIGMKAASCWFSPKWSVETQALGDAVKRKVSFDVNSIVENETNTLTVNISESLPGAHFTNIHLADVYSMPTKHALSKVREHLTSIYRDFLRNDSVAITVNGQLLKYKAPAILVAPPFTDKSAQPIQWRKELSFICAGGQRVTGFAAIYATASTKEAGFALFRRGRVVEGSLDEGYRPEKIFGNTNSYYYQRIFGELNLDDFTASFTKDGMQWEDAEEDFLSRLREAMKTPGLDLFKQANGMRVRESAGSGANGTNSASGVAGSSPSAGEPPQGNSANSGARVSTSSTTVGILSLFGGSSNNSPSIKAIENDTKGLLTPAKPEIRILTASLNSVSWRIYIELSNNPAHTDWLAVNSLFIPQEASAGINERLLGVRISLAHPFTTKYCAASSSQIEPLLRLGAAFALARAVAKEGNATHSGVLMDYINELLLKL